MGRASSAIGVALYGKLKRVRRVERQSPAPIKERHH
jgi:hypothetical protein